MPPRAEVKGMDQILHNPFEFQKLKERTKLNPMLHSMIKSEFSKKKLFVGSEKSQTSRFHETYREASGEMVWRGNERTTGSNAAKILKDERWRRVRRQDRDARGIVVPLGEEEDEQRWASFCG
ncbi:unnamed protein product [Linum trigynum]|uniref:Uncharacterized protein n=1 Tax=Linum trigynum TaxID=586398 RepID=A0AAV2FQE0_9ROSI